MMAFGEEIPQVDTVHQMEVYLIDFLRTLLLLSLKWSENWGFSGVQIEDFASTLREIDETLFYWFIYLSDSMEQLSQFKKVAKDFKK